VLSDRTATPSAYKNARLTDFDFIHFATHATAPSDPLDSAVILAPDPNGYNLYGRTIIDHPLRAEVVTISSCNSAGRRNYAGEGLVGLAWAFLRAGAHRVVAAQWEVNDVAAPLVMNDMYTAMIDDGLEPAAALRRAQLDLLHSDGRLKSPLYWAPFVVYGAL
jgi:CHAT domain-containing protein